MKITREAIKSGGVGYVHEHDVERFLEMQKLLK